MGRGGSFALLLAGLSTSFVWAGPGDYDAAYEQGGGYGAGTLDERVAKLEKKLSSDSQLEMLKRMEQLQGDVLRLRGEVEDLSHQLETVKKQQKDMYLDVDRRLQAGAAPQAPAAQAETQSEQQQQESPPTATPTPPIPPAAPAPQPQVEPPRPPSAPPVKTVVPLSTPSATPAAPVAPSPQKPVAAKPLAADDASARQAAYQKAFNVLKDGRYADAIKEFKSFLASYPKGEYSDNAAYWLAEAQYVNRDLSAARESFRKVVKEYPQASKTADSLLKLGYIDYDSGQWVGARETLNDVIKRYPDSSAAKLAQKRLDKMKLEGH